MRDAFIDGSFFRMETAFRIYKSGKSYPGRAGVGLKLPRPRPGWPGQVLHPCTKLVMCAHQQVYARERLLRAV